MRKAISIALEKGYKMADDGVLIGMKGKPLKVRLRGKQRYPTFSVNVGDLTPSTVYGVPVHKFAAYWYYGEDSYVEGLVVRHLDGDTLNVSKENLVMGTHSENNLDKCPKVRRNAAIKARASQGSRPLNAKLTADQVRIIRERYANGESGYSISEDYGISGVTVYELIKRRKYADVI